MKTEKDKGMMAFAPVVGVAALVVAVVLGLVAARGRKGSETVEEVDTEVEDYMIIEDAVDCDSESNCEWLWEDEVCDRRRKKNFNPKQGNQERPPPEDPSLPPFSEKNIKLDPDSKPNNKMGMPNSKRKKAANNYKKCGRADCKKCKNV